MNENSMLSSKTSFSQRHVGSTEPSLRTMLKFLDEDSISRFMGKVIPESIRFNSELNLPSSSSELELEQELRRIFGKNRLHKSWIGMGYANCSVPGVIRRGILENPGWYTQYTPYQAEISQGRLEGLFNFQTMVTELTGMDVANASLLDEGTAAVEAMQLSLSLYREEKQNPRFFVSDQVHPQVIEVLKGRSSQFGIDLLIGDHRDCNLDGSIFGALLQYPSTEGIIYDYAPFIEKAREKKVLVTVSADILSLLLIKSPFEIGADIAIGNTQRFGVPLGFGGPHAAYFATRKELSRKLPGRIVGLSKNSEGKKALRLALQTREQHIRREKATSNICTAQALLANMAGMFAVYHGELGLKKIASRVHSMAATLAEGLKKLGYSLSSEPFFDTVLVRTTSKKTADSIYTRAQRAEINIRKYKENKLSISFDETTSEADIFELLSVFAEGKNIDFSIKDIYIESILPKSLMRKNPVLQQAVFNKYQTETEMLRYIKRLEGRDLSLTHSMIPLGSCTMKLNASAELFPLTWPEVSNLHPFVPKEQSVGYREMLSSLEQMLAEITGFAGVSLQPNSGAQGEYTGLLVIKAYHKQRNEKQRNVCLIPSSAHGTNPASARLANLKVVTVGCDSNGNIDLLQLKEKAEKHANNLAAMMVTYPSTHGVFEENITEICQVIHDNGGQVYMDGANFNAQIGYCRPGDFGVDVCHLNLHKTFAIPHGGGGPGAGPIAVAGHLQEFLPGHQVCSLGNENSIHAVSSAPYGSASILTISWSYIKLMGAAGLKNATETAIINANYIAKRLEDFYDVLYKGKNGYVAHECIIDLRSFKKECGIDVEDIAKRLMDFGFHAPTVSFPIANTMMIEPTESESIEELDRFCEAMIVIHQEIQQIKQGEVAKDNNLLKNAPHTMTMVSADLWDHAYSRKKAAFPCEWLHENKFWPYSSRIDNAFGDRNFCCSLSEKV